MKVLVSGDRNWSDGDFLEGVLDDLVDEKITGYVSHSNFLLIQGGCRGADTFALRWAQGRKYPYRTFPADWDKFGTKAGPIRNRQMLDEKPDIVIAFHDNLSRSKGTLDTVMEANRRGIEVRIISSKKRSG